MSIFGWSYPPGAAGDPSAPYNQEEGPCEVCGSAVDDCACADCPTCGCCGDPACYDKGGKHFHGLTASMAQLHGQAILEECYRAQAKADAAEGEYWRAHK